MKAEEKSILPRRESFSKNVVDLLKEDELDLKLEDNLPNVIQTISQDFELKDSYRIAKHRDQLVNISYNSKKKMFILVDSSGITTWEWSNLTNRINRVIDYDVKQSKNIVNFVYCSVHNCYFALRPDNSISVFNHEFEEVIKTTHRNRTIFCMIYNPVNDELLTSSVDGIKIWCLKQTEDTRWRTLKVLSNYSLVIKLDKKIELDTFSCHLYCCTNRDLYIFDFNGNLIKHYQEVHTMPITCCVYSASSKVVLTGSMDTDIKIWSLAGGLIETFRGHSKPVTNLVLNPYNSNLILSSSLDGTIKMWSLDIMQQLYQLNLYQSEILWMGLTEEKILYVSSTFDLTLWKITNFIEFWALARDRIRMIKLDSYQNKSTRILTISDENTIRIFNRDKALQITVILPIPKLRNKSEILSTIYCRANGLMYILLNTNELWLYYTKTNPSTHINVWNTLEIQELLDDDSDEREQHISAIRLEEKRKPNNLVVQELLRTHRAVDFSLSYQTESEKVKCYSIGVLESVVNYWNLEGACCPLSRNFLLFGLENGKILFCDTLIQNKKYFALNCSKDPVVEIFQDKLYNNLVVRVDLKSLYHIEYFSLPDLELKYELFCSKTMTSYARLNENVLLGFDDGSIDLVPLKHVREKDTSKRVPNENEIEMILNRHVKYEHRQRIEIIDVCPNLEIFLSCSLDGFIKLWSSSKSLIGEIKLDNTLSCCRFLNSNGDMIIGWRNHLFTLILKRILPQYNKLSKEVDEDLLEDSIVIEDHSLKKSNDQEPFKIDLNKYLFPFEINFNKEGVFKVKVDEAKKKGNKSSDKNDQITNDGTNSMESFASTLPESFLSTPRDNPLNNLNLVDLTLNTKIARTDLRLFLVDLLSESLSQTKSVPKLFPKEWRFPKFGESPSSTPSCTPPSTIREPPEIKIEQVKFLPPSIKPIEPTAQIVLTKILFNKKPTKEEEEADLERRLRERMPKYQETNFRDVKINSKNLIDSSTTIKMIPNSQKSEDFGYRNNERLSISGTTRPVKKRSVNKKSSSKKKSSSHKDSIKSSDDEGETTNNYLLDENKSEFYQSEYLNESQNSRGDGFINQYRRKKVDRISTAKPINLNLNLFKSKNDLINRMQSVSTSTIKQNDSNLNDQFNNSKSPTSADSAKSFNESKRNISSISKESGSFSIDDLNKDQNESSILKSREQSNNQSASERIKSDMDRSTSAKVNFNLDNQDDDYSKRESRTSDHQTTATNNQSSDKSNGFFIKAIITDSKTKTIREKMTRENISKDLFISIKSKQKLKDSNKFQQKKNTDQVDIEKTKNLFEYLYGMQQGFPKRVRSASYILPFDSSSSSKPNIIGDNNDNNKNELADMTSQTNFDLELLEEIEKNFGKIQISNNLLNNPFFKNWLKNYEIQRRTLNDRIDRARQKQATLLNEKMKRWSASIARKNSITSNNRQYLSRSSTCATSSTNNLLSRPISSNVGISNRQRKNSECNNNHTTTAMTVAQLNNNEDQIISPKRETKSAAYDSINSINNKKTTTNSLTNKRPKSVSFVFDSNLLNDSKRNYLSQEDNNKANNKTKSIIRMQPAYLVSQIELEEILKEAAERVEMRKNEFSHKNKHNHHQKHQQQQQEWTENSDLEENSIEKCKLSSNVWYNDASYYVETETDTDDNMNDSLSISSSKIKKEKTIQHHRTSGSFVNSASSRRIASGKHSRATTTTTSGKLTDITLASENVRSTEHRLSLKSHNSQYSKSNNWSKISEYTDSEEYSDQEKLSKKQIIDNLLRVNRTPSSIPSLHRRSNYKKEQYDAADQNQEIHLEYQLPNCPERYLLPIRFPKLYSKIIFSLLRIRSSNSSTHQLINKSEQISQIKSH